MLTARIELSSIRPTTRVLIHLLLCFGSFAVPALQYTNQADSVQVHRSTRVANTSKVPMTSTVDNTGTLEQSSASESSATPHETLVMEFALFNNLRTDNDHQEQIRICFAAKHL